MATESLAGVISRLRAIALVSHHTMSDADLLNQFVSRRDEAAFEALVRRHGPMVFGVCRRVLRHYQDAEDAFQATFLVLAHKAASVSPPTALAGWLHGVAHKTALKARHRAARRSEVEKQVPLRGPEAMNPETNWEEVKPLLDQELAALSDCYRLPIILCDLEGRPRTEVAQTLGCPEGTLSSRLTRGRRLLAERLKRRGVHLSACAVALLFAERSVALTEPLIRVTVRVALSAAIGAACAVSPSVAELATGVMKTMFLKKLQSAVFAVFAVAALTLTGLAVYQSQGAAPAPNTAPDPAVGEKALNESLANVEGWLLMNRKVVKDLKCDFDQFNRIMDTLEEAEKKANQKTNEAMARIQFNPAANPNIQQMIQAAQEEGEKEFRKAVEGVVKDILSPAQRMRLREIDLQLRGHEAFTTPAVEKELQLTAKQKEQFEANAKRVEDDITQALQKPVVGQNVAAGANGVVIGGFGVAPGDFEKTIRDARAEGLKRALEILTNEQKATWKKLTGEPFTHPVSNPKPRHGGFGFGGGIGGAIAPAPGGVQILPLLPANGVPAVPADPAK